MFDKISVGPAPPGSHLLSSSASAGRLYRPDGDRLLALSFAGS